MSLSWHIVSSQESREEYRERPHQIRCRLGKKEEKRRKEKKRQTNMIINARRIERKRGDVRI